MKTQLTETKTKASNRMKITKKPKLAAMMKSVALDALPMEVIIEIARLVVSSSPSSSIPDLANMKITCKMLSEVASDKWVLSRVAIVDRLRRLGWWMYQKGSWLLVLDCAEAGNPQASCILGMDECYARSQREKGMLHLTAAAEKGCPEAMYALAIMYLSEEGPSKTTGMEWLERAAQANGGGAIGLIKSRKMAVQLLRDLWIAEGLLQPQAWQCMDDNCAKLQREDATRGWWCEEDQEVDRRFCSSLCRSIYEFNKFVMDL